MFIELLSIKNKADKYDEYGLVKEANVCDSRVKRLSKFINNVYKYDLSDRLLNRLVVAKSIYERWIKTSSEADERRKQRIEKDINFSDEWDKRIKDGMSESAGFLFHFAPQGEYNKYNINPFDPNTEALLKNRAGNIETNTAFDEVTQDQAKEIVNYLYVREQGKGSEERLHYRKTMFPRMPLDEFKDLLSRTYMGIETDSELINQFDPTDEDSDRALKNEIQLRLRGMGYNSSSGRFSSGGNTDSSVASIMQSLAENTQKIFSSYTDDVDFAHLLVSKGMKDIGDTDVVKHEEKQRESKYIERRIFGGDNNIMLMGHHIDQMIDRLKSEEDVTDKNIVDIVSSMWNFSSKDRSPFQGSESESVDGLFTFRAIDKSKNMYNLAVDIARSMSPETVGKFSKEEILGAIKEGMIPTEDGPVEVGMLARFQDHLEDDAETAENALTLIDYKEFKKRRSQEREKGSDEEMSPRLAKSMSEMMDPVMFMVSANDDSKGQLKIMVDREEVNMRRVNKLARVICSLFNAYERDQFQTLNKEAITLSLAAISRTSHRSAISKSLDETNSSGVKFRDLLPKDDPAPYTEEQSIAEVMASAGEGSQANKDLSKIVLESIASDRYKRNTVGDQTRFSPRTTISDSLGVRKDRAYWAEIIRYLSKDYFDFKKNLEEIRRVSDKNAYVKEENVGWHGSFRNAEAKTVVPYTYSWLEGVGEKTGIQKRGEEVIIDVGDDSGVNQDQSKEYMKDMALDDELMDESGLSANQRLQMYLQFGLGIDQEALAFVAGIGNPHRDSANIKKTFKEKLSMSDEEINEIAPRKDIKGGYNSRRDSINDDGSNLDVYTAIYLAANAFDKSRKGIASHMASEGEGWISSSEGKPMTPKRKKMLYRTYHLMKMRNLLKGMEYDALEADILTQMESVYSVRKGLDYFVKKSKGFYEKEIAKALHKYYANLSKLDRKGENFSKNANKIFNTFMAERSDAIDKYKYASKMDVLMAQASARTKERVISKNQRGENVNFNINDLSTSPAKSVDQYKAFLNQAINDTDPENSDNDNADLLHKFFIKEKGMYDREDLSDFSYYPDLSETEEQAEESSSELSSIVDPEVVKNIDDPSVLLHQYGKLFADYELIDGREPVKQSPPEVEVEVEEVGETPPEGITDESEGDYEGLEGYDPFEGVGFPTMVRRHPRLVPDSAVETEPESPAAIAPSRNLSDMEKIYLGMWISYLDKVGSPAIVSPSDKAVADSLGITTQYYPASENNSSPHWRITDIPQSVRLDFVKQSSLSPIDRLTTFSDREIDEILDKYGIEE
jgi:hypothetical protein